VSKTSPELDMLWPFDWSTQPHNKAAMLVHLPFIATLSDRFIGVQCTCGTNWCMPRLDVA
jgi:hypothetical protein